MITWTNDKQILIILEFFSMLRCDTKFDKKSMTCLRAHDLSYSYECGPGWIYNPLWDQKSDFNLLLWFKNNSFKLIAKTSIFSVKCKVESSTQLTHKNKFITKIKSFHLSAKDHTTWRYTGTSHLFMIRWIYWLYLMWSISSTITYSLFKRLRLLYCFLQIVFM